MPREKPSQKNHDGRRELCSEYRARRLKPEDTIGRLMQDITWRATRRVLGKPDAMMELLPKLVELAEQLGIESTIFVKLAADPDQKDERLWEQADLLVIAIEARLARGASVNDAPPQPARAPINGGRPLTIQQIRAANSDFDEAAMDRIRKNLETAAKRRRNLRFDENQDNGTKVAAWDAQLVDETVNKEREKHGK